MGNIDGEPAIQKKRAGDPKPEGGELIDRITSRSIKS